MHLIIKYLHGGYTYHILHWNEDAWAPNHFSHIRLLETWTVALQAPPSMGFSRQEYWSGLPCPSPGDLPDPRMEPTSLMSPALAGGLFTTSATVFLKKLKIELPHDPAILLLGIHPEKMKTLIQKDTCTPKFSAALFKTAKTWKHPKHPLTEEWIKKM